MPDWRCNGDPAKFAKLLEANGLSEIGEFNQGTFRTKLGSEKVTHIGNKPLDNGYCAGVCMDWIRRVLQSKSDRDQRYLSYYYKALKEESDLPKGRDLSVQKGRAYTSASTMGFTWFVNNELKWQSVNSGPFTTDVNAWKNAAAQMDRYFERERTEAERAKTKKPYSSLLLIDSLYKQYPTAGHWMAAVDKAVKSQCCTYFGFNKSGQSGHAVTVWQRNDDVNVHGAFYLFDPNLGVFSCTKTALKTALQLMFWLDDQNIPFYDGCASKVNPEMSYRIFGIEREEQTVSTPIQAKPQPVPTQPQPRPSPQTRQPPPKATPQPTPNPQGSTYSAPKRQVQPSGGIAALMRNLKQAGLTDNA
jgi:hypothetical protein